MFFRDIKGHQKQKSLLVRLVRKDRMPHAQIFFGSAQSGKLAFARALISYIFCEQRTDSDSCGICPSCVKTHRLIHPDVHFTVPTIGTNVTSGQLIKEWRALQLENPYSNYQQWLAQIGGENKQGNINKEECNEVMKILNLRPFEGEQKVWLVWGAEFLGNDGNRLLKIIEEPPEGTYIILISNQLEPILNTIKSRCQTLNFPPLQASEVEATLAQQLKEVSDQQIQFAANLSEGDIHKAMDLLSQSDAEIHELWSSWLKHALSDQAHGVSECTDRIARLNKEQIKYWVQYGLFYIRELLWIKGGVNSVRLQAKELALANRIAEKVSTEFLASVMDHLESLHTSILRNGNAKLVIFNTYLQIQQAFRVHPKNAMVNA